MSFPHKAFSPARSGGNINNVENVENIERFAADSAESSCVRDGVNPPRRGEGFGRPKLLNAVKSILLFTTGAALGAAVAVTMQSIGITGGLNALLDMTHASGTVEANQTGSSGTSEADPTTGTIRTIRSNRTTADAADGGARADAKAKAEASAEAAGRADAGAAQEGTLSAATVSFSGEHALSPGRLPAAPAQTSNSSTGGPASDAAAGGRLSPFEDLIRRAEVSAAAAAWDSSNEKRRTAGGSVAVKHLFDRSAAPRFVVPQIGRAHV